MKETQSKHNCAQCAIRAKHDAAPKSFLGRFWRWHINFCPGWKSYMKSLDDEQRLVIQREYNLKR